MTRTRRLPASGSRPRRPLRAAQGRVILLFCLAASLGSAAPARAFADGEEHRRFGDSTSSRHYPRDREVDMRHMVLNLSFDWSRKWVGGEATFTLVPLAEGLQTIALDSADLRVSRVASGATPLGFRTAGQRLLVDLGRTVPPGEEITFTVAYDANPRKGLHFVGPDRAYPGKPRQIYSQGESEDNHYWFPCYDYPNDRATFETYLTVDSNQTAVSNGRLVEVKALPGRGKRTFHYSQEVPAPSYLLSVAIGEFDRVQQDYEGIPVEYYVPRGTSKDSTLRSFGLTPDMMKFFSERIGVRYPYPKYAQSAIVDFIYGGMENISATTQTFETLHPADLENEASSQALVAHELAHQWWGDLLTCRDWAHAWLNEGFATYFEALYNEHHKGKDEFQYEMLGNARSYFTEDSEKYRRPIVEPLYTDPMDVFDSHLYPKGAWTLHMLRGMLGDDLFWKSIHRYADLHRAGIVVTDDLRRAFEEETGQSLVWFFEEWYEHGGHPEYRVSQDWDDKTKTARLKVEQVQRVDDLTPLFRMPVRVVFATQAGDREFTLLVSRAREDFTFPLPAPPLMTRFDAGNLILKTLDFERSLAELSYQLVHDPDVAGRIWAAQRLGTRRADSQAAAALAAALAHEPFWGVRAEMAEALGKLRLPEGREALMRALKDADSRTRAAAVAALGRFRDDAAAAEAIRAVFRTEGNVYVRAAAAKAYARARGAEAFALLKEASAIPSYRDVIAVGAYEGMEDLADPRAVPLLQEGARYGKPRRQREGAIRVLGKLAKGDGKAQVVDFLMQLLQDPWVFARDAAIVALGKAGDEKALPALLDSSEGEWDSRVRRHAREAVASIRKSAAGASDVEALRSRIEQIQDETQGLRERMDRLEREKGGSIP